jgi:transcriptional regulator with XRE-family HTH domain
MSDMLAAVDPVDALLTARGSSKRWLAGKLGMKESTLSRYLSGSRPAPPDLYERIADVLHVPVDFLKRPAAEVAA